MRNRGECRGVHYSKHTKIDIVRFAKKEGK